MKPLNRAEVKNVICQILTERFGFCGPEDIYLDKFMLLNPNSAVFVVRDLNPSTSLGGIPFWAEREEEKIKIKPVPEWLWPYLL